MGGWARTASPGCAPRAGAAGPGVPGRVGLRSARLRPASGPGASGPGCFRPWGRGPPARVGVPVGGAPRPALGFQAWGGGASAVTPLPGARRPAARFPVDSRTPGRGAGAQVSSRAGRCCTERARVSAPSLPWPRSRTPGQAPASAPRLPRPAQAQSLHPPVHPAARPSRRTLTAVVSRQPPGASGTSRAAHLPPASPGSQAPRTHSASRDPEMRRPWAPQPAPAGRRLAQSRPVTARKAAPRPALRSSPGPPGSPSPAPVLSTRSPSRSRSQGSRSPPRKGHQAAPARPRLPPPQRAARRPSRRDLLSRRQPAADSRGRPAPGPRHRKPRRPREAPLASRNRRRWARTTWMRCTTTRGR